MTDVQVNYESLAAVANSFKGQADSLEAMAKSVHQHFQQLQGGWEGEGWEAFSNEMSQLLTPRLKRLVCAFDDIHTTITQISQTMREAEEEAANRLNNEDDSSKTPKEDGTAKPSPQPTPKPVTQVPYKHTVVPGDTLWDLARRYGTTVDAIVAANNIPNPDLIYPGQQFIIPGKFVDVPAEKPTDLGNSGRTADQLSQKIDSFNVEGNERYAKFRDGNPNTYDTYCNLFASDVAKSMGAELPIFVTDGQGNITKWLGATMMKEWLDGKLNVSGSYQQGPAMGWQKVDAATAAQAANQGFVTIAAGHGHMAVVRPGSPVTGSVGDLHIAQAGERNFNHGTLSQGWGQWTGEAELYVFRPK